MVLDGRLCLVSEMLHEQDQDNGGDAEDEAGEADHHRGDHVMEPHGGGHQPRVRAGAPGHVGVQLLQPVHGAHVTHRQQPLESMKQEVLDCNFDKYW